jgi:hypothetical protein
MYKEMSFHVQFTTRKLNSHFEQITYFSSWIWSSISQTYWKCWELGLHQCLLRWCKCVNDNVFLNWNTWLCVYQRTGCMGWLKPKAAFVANLFNFMVNK